MPTSFLDLPADVLPVIISHIYKASHLADICLVNHRFREYATPCLYECIYVYPWHKKDRVEQVIQIFSTLATKPHLASYVRRLEIRDFPKLAFKPIDLAAEIISLCVQGLHNCVSLRWCTWTRDGSLETVVLQALWELSSLRGLEINGRHEGFYSPRILTEFTRLERLSLIMPSHDVIHTLPGWMERAGEHLKHLTIICKTSTHVSNQLVKELAPHLRNLETVHFVGCSRLTESGILSILESSQNGLRALGLESISPSFDISAFSAKTSASFLLANLRSITLTVYREDHLSLAEWGSSVLTMLANSRLEYFQMYSSVGETMMPTSFWTALVNVHGRTLRRFSVHKLLIPLSVIEDVCKRCTELEQLFVVAAKVDLTRVSDSLSYARKLRTVHINFPRTTRVSLASVDPVDLGDGDTQQASSYDEDYHSLYGHIDLLSIEEATSLVRRLGEAIVQFGCNTRVWQVQREVIHRKAENGETVLELVRKLAPYERPEVPEQFLVMRS